MRNELLWDIDEPSPYGNDDSYVPDDIDFSCVDECPECGYALDDHGQCDFCDG